MKKIKRFFERSPHKKLNDHQTNERMMALWTRWVGVFALFSIVVAIITAVILYLQRRDTQYEQRAWVYADAKPISAIAYDRDGLHLNIRFTFHNTGKLPAKGVAPSFDVAVDGTPSKSWPELQKKACPEPDRNAAGYMGVTVFPAQEGAFENRQVKIALPAGDTAIPTLIDVAGCIWYLSAGDWKLHRTYFAYQLADNRRFPGLSPKDGTVPLENVVLVPIEIKGFGFDDD